MTNSIMKLMAGSLLLLSMMNIAFACNVADLKLCDLNYGVCMANPFTASSACEALLAECKREACK